MHDFLKFIMIVWKEKRNVATENSRDKGSMTRYACAESVILSSRAGAPKGEDFIFAARA